MVFKQGPSLFNKIVIISFIVVGVGLLTVAGIVIVDYSKNW